MGSFNTVFAIVQKECKEKGSVKGDDWFLKIATQAGVPVEKLHFYLDCIQETGVIQYLPEKKAIMMTEKGVKSFRVFP